jgi:hypothetical protein
VRSGINLQYNLAQWERPNLPKAGVRMEFVAFFVGLATNPIFGLFVGFILGAVAMSGKVSGAGANWLLLFAFLVAAFGIVNANLKDLRSIGASILALVILCLLLSYWISPNRLTLVAEPAFTIHDLFSADFSPGSFKMLEGFTTDFKKGDQNLGVHDFEVGLYGDFTAKSLFMSFYTPGSKDAYDIISWFAMGYKIYLADMRKNIHIWSAPQGDQSQPLSDDLIFTKTIYIYYEKILSDDRVHALETVYRANGLAPIFRGFGYLQYRKIQAKSDPATAPKLPDPTKIIKGPPMNLPPLDTNPAPEK